MRKNQNPLLSWIQDSVVTLPTGWKESVSVFEGFWVSFCAAVILGWGLLLASKHLPLPEPILDLVIFWEKADKAKRWESRHYRHQVKTYSSMPTHTSHNGFPAVRPGVPSLPPWCLLLLHFLPPCLLDCAQGLSFIWWLQFCSDLFSIHGNLKCEGRMGDDRTHQVLLITHHSSHHNSASYDWGANVD